MKTFSCDAISSHASKMKQIFAWNKYRRAKPCTTESSQKLQYLLLDALRPQMFH